jgi:hypothetical protein
MNGPGTRSGLMVLLTSGIVDERLGLLASLLSTASPSIRTGLAWNLRCHQQLES